MVDTVVKVLKSSRECPYWLQVERAYKGCVVASVAVAVAATCHQDTPPHSLANTHAPRHHNNYSPVSIIDI